MSITTASVESKGQVYSTYNETNKAGKKTGDYGKSIGDPKLTDEGKKYYEELKKKYGNMDFILVSKDMKEQAKAQASAFANPSKTVVLIDEDKVNRMAVDESYRKQYEGVISNASTNIAQLKQSIVSSGAQVKGYGMQFNDGGTASFFAVLKKSSAAQKDRITKHAADKASQKKLAARKAAKQEAEERLEGKKADKKDSVHTHNSKEYSSVEAPEETVTITANSIEELMQKISDYTVNERGDNVQTVEEKMLGQHVDFRG